jgi:hypothetical protein
LLASQDELRHDPEGQALHRCEKSRRRGRTATSPRGRASAPASPFSVHRDARPRPRRRETQICNIRRWLDVGKWRLSADRLHSESSRALVSRSLRKGVIGFTEIRSDNPTTDPIPREDAFLVALQYASSQSQILGRRPRQTPVFSLKGRYSGTDNEVGRRNRSRLINWGTPLNI